MDDFDFIENIKYNNVFIDNDNKIPLYDVQKIYSHTDEDHNTVTPILKLDGAKYNFYIILRNNYSTEEQPYGLYQCL